MSTESTVQDPRTVTLCSHEKIQSTSDDDSTASSAGQAPSLSSDVPDIPKKRKHGSAKKEVLEDKIDGTVVEAKSPEDVFGIKDTQEPDQAYKRAGKAVPPKIEGSSNWTSPCLYNPNALGLTTARPSIERFLDDLSLTFFNMISRMLNHTSSLP